VENAIPTDGRFVLLAESFSTPLAVRLAATNPVNLAGLVICAGFVTNPLDRWLRIVRVLVRPSLFRRSLPDSILDYFLIGSHPPRDLRDTVHRTLRSVSPEVMALRARAVMNCDAREYLAKVQVPILYLQAAHDRLVKDRCFAEIKRLKPDTVLASILGPHLLLQREPHQGAEAIVKFLQRL
jgi:pimeloyl-[acyl-carrier protein] methyl ester esterase